MSTSCSFFIPKPEQALTPQGTTVFVVQNSYHYMSEPFGGIDGGMANGIKISVLSMHAQHSKPCKYGILCHPLAGKATALREGDSASKAADQPHPVEGADALPNQATADTNQEEDDWEPAPKSKRTAAIRKGTTGPPARRRRGGRKRQALESDSQDSAEEEAERQLAVSCAHGLRNKQSRKQLVIEDEDLEEDLGLGDGKPVIETRQHPGAAEAADVTTAMPQESGVLSKDSMAGYKHIDAGPSSITHQAQTGLPHSVPHEQQDTGGTEAARATHSTRNDADHGGSSGFSLLDAMLQPDMSDSYTASGNLRPSGSSLHPEHKSADGQQQAALVSDTPQPSGLGQDLPPSRPPQKGSLRDRVKAFAAMRK